MGSLSFLQGIFPTQVSHIAGGSFTSWATREAQEYWNGWPIPSPEDLPDPGVEPGSPAELPGKPLRAAFSELTSFQDSDHPQQSQAELWHFLLELSTRFTPDCVSLPWSLTFFLFPVFLLSWSFHRYWSIINADTLDSISSATRELNMQGRVLRMIQVNRRQKGHLSSVTYSSAGDEGPIMVGGRAQVASAMKWPSDGKYWPVVNWEDI